MSTRAVVYLHTKDEEQVGAAYTMKLYHHYDWYIQGWLWEDLVNMIEEIRKGKDWCNNWSMRAIFEWLARVGWFEPTVWKHWDTEFVYHLYYDLGYGPAWYEFYYKLEVELGEDLWPDSWSKRYIMCCNWDWEKKDYNLKEFRKKCPRV